MSPTSFFAKFAFPSYELPGTLSLSLTEPLYAKGWWDVAFVAYYVVFWTFARSTVIDYAIKPLARAAGVPRRLWDRFGEQGWLVVYYTLAFSVGFKILYASPYWLNTAQFWVDYPHKYVTGEFKAYYLVQLAFWIQQLFVVHIEKPRKDYTQYVVHHLVTCTLLVSSYYVHYTRIGHAVLVTMDVADIFLCLAKCFNYVKWRAICDATFVVFVAVWVASRHVAYYFIARSLWTDIYDLVEIKWDPENGHYMSVTLLRTFLLLLAVLQVLLVYWLYLIVRVVLKVARGNKAEDSRSDDEE
ncbi:sphingosine N-acyltransferase lag1 [Allomyces javanicus]|nr:sphingosine N-acyltransferase lag1 [Allomyces javanicus]